MRGATRLFVHQRVFLVHFNPRSSCEERLHVELQLENLNISIHAPHARSDSRGADMRVQMPDFNPRSSCEERRAGMSSSTSRYSNFNPRSSCEERRGLHRRSDLRGEISIHAPHARSDYHASQKVRHEQISIHAPHARSDIRAATTMSKTAKISIHAPHARSDSHAA